MNNSQDLLLVLLSIDSIQFKCLRISQRITYKVVDLGVWNNSPASYFPFLISSMPHFFITLLCSYTEQIQSSFTSLVNMLWNAHFLSGNSWAIFHVTTEVWPNQNLYRFTSVSLKTTLITIHHIFVFFWFLICKIF